MRKLIYSVGTSIDGYIADPKGGIGFLFMPEDFSMADFMASVDVILMGSRTYDHCRNMGFPIASSDSSKVYVLSRTRDSGDRDGVSFTRLSPRALLNRLRATPGKDIWLMGGGELARSCFQAGLIDELHLGIVPVLLGNGIRAFPSPFPKQNFEQIEVGSYQGGMISLKYARKT